MPLLYSDPYKDNKFGKIKGDKRNEYLKVTFEECKFYKQENSYILAGQFTNFMGVTRAYKPELPLTPGLVELPIYGSDYEIRQKKSNTGIGNSQYETITLTPSIAEKLLYQHIEDNPSQYLQDEFAFNGSLTLHPDIDYQNDDPLLSMQKVINNLSLVTVNWSGKYPQWEAPKTYNKSYGKSYSKSAQIEDKVAWLKKELADTIAESHYKENTNLPLAAYVHKVIDDNHDNEKFLVVYFDLIRSIVR